MEPYTVFRKGWNAANNSALMGGRETVEVGEYEAESEEAAVNAALADGTTVYNNQSMWAEKTSEVTARRLSAKRKRIA